MLAMAFELTITVSKTVKVVNISSVKCLLATN